MTAARCRRHAGEAVRRPGLATRHSWPRVRELVSRRGPRKLPPFYAFVGRFLPPGATVSIVRTAVYFRRDQHLEPFIVQAVWLVGTLAALLISARRLGRGPAQ